MSQGIRHAPFITSAMNTGRKTAAGTRTGRRDHHAPGPHGPERRRRPPYVFLYSLACVMMSKIVRQMPTKKTAKAWWRITDSNR